jgi:hypothetical protein
MWNVVIAEVRHEEQVFASSSMQRLDAHNKYARDVEFMVIFFWDSH